MKPRDISSRFLLSKKSHSLVNLVAIVSVVALLVPTAAMVIVLSVQNGLSDMIHSRFSNFDSELRVIPRSGQLFEVDSAQIAAIEEFAVVSQTLRCNALVEWGSESTIAELYGTDSLYTEVSGMAQMVDRGEWQMRRGSEPRAVIGSALSYSLGVSIAMADDLRVTAIIPTPRLPIDIPIPLLNTKDVRPVGVYTLDASIDSRYIFTPIEFVRSLMGQSRNISTLELKPLIPTEEAKQRLYEILGDGVEVQNRYEQRADLYSVIDSEKVVIFTVLIFVALIAAMSLSGCVLMMVAEKASSASTLRALGMSHSKVRGVFISLGLRVVIIGIAAGLALGIAVVLLQQNLGLLQLGGVMGSEPYPVKLSISDTLLTTAILLGVGYLIVVVTVSRIKFSTIVK